jgi:hypothetical protein
MKLLVDMNLSPRWIQLLNTRGWEAIHWSTLGEATATDSEIMAFAATHEYVVSPTTWTSVRFLQQRRVTNPVSSRFDWPTLVRRNVSRE